MEMHIEIKNLTQVRAALMQSPAIVGKHIQKAVNESIIDVRDASVKETPVDTGRLRGSYQLSFGNLSAETGPTANYAIFVHEGHRQQVGRFVPVLGKRLVAPFVKANPFMQRGISAVKDRINKNFADRLEDALNEIGSKA